MELYVEEVASTGVQGIVKVLVREHAKLDVKIQQSVELHRMEVIMAEARMAVAVVEELLCVLDVPLPVLQVVVAHVPAVAQANAVLPVEALVEQVV